MKEKLSSNKLERYSKLLELAVTDAPFKEMLTQLLIQLESDIGACKASFLLASKDDSHFICTASPSLGKAYESEINKLGINKQTGSCGSAIVNQKLCIIKDVSQSEFWKPYLEFAQQKNIKSSWSYPIRDQENNIVGSVDVYHEEARHPKDKELEIIKEISRIACLKIEHERAKANNSLSSVITNYLPVGILVTDKELNIIDVNPALCSISGFDKEELIGQKPFSFSLDSNAMNKLFNMLKHLDAGQSWTSEMAFKKKSGETYISETRITLVRDSQGKVTRGIGLITDITEKKETEKTIEYQTHYDLLTGLPNRNSFYKQLSKNISRAQSKHNNFYIMLLDLDHFKEINDSIGHEYGDELLVLIAKRLEKLLAKSDMIARLGGDEFGFIFNNELEHKKIIEMADSILKTVSHPLSIKEMSDSYISSSIGIAHYPKDGKNIEELLKSADQAMYESKSKGRNSYTFFTKKLKEAAQRKAILHRELRIAVYEKPDQFSLHFQPIIQKETKKLCQLEALLRWHHPEYGLISPVDFIPLAEKSGLASKVGGIVQENACKAASIFKKSGIQTKVSINFSTDEFKNDTVCENFLTLLRQYHLKPEDVVVEITESLFAENAEQTLKHLKRFKNQGIHIAIDDFGTGYSSLSYLASFPIDELKIDRSFVSNIHKDKRKMSLVRSIINIGHSLDMYIVAEGVEQSEELNFLESEGCNLIQGYLISKPKPLDEIIEKYSPTNQ